MEITTILNDGKPWVICKPSDAGDLERFLAASEGIETGAGFTHRAATPQEQSKWQTAYILRKQNHEDPEQLFGIEE